MSNLRSKWEKVKSKRKMIKSKIKGTSTKQSKFYDADKRTEYFVNPTVKELNSIPSGLVRFIADNNTKQVFVWDGSEVLHYEALPFLGIIPDAALKLMSKYLLGSAMKKGGKYVMLDAYLIDRLINVEGVKGKDSEVLMDTLNMDWSWVNSYIQVNSYLTNQRDDFKKFLETREMLDRLSTVKVSMKIAEELVKLAEKIIK